MKAFFTSALIALGLSISASAMAQMDHSMHGSAAAKPAAKTADADLGEGLVKKIDVAKGTVTLAHGALPNGMPPMTMAYRVKEVAWLNTMQVGQKIRFATDPANGGMTISRFEPAK